MPPRFRTQLSELDADTVHSSHHPYYSTPSFPRLGAQRSSNALLRSVFPAGFSSSASHSTKRQTPLHCDIILDAATPSLRDHHSDDERSSRVSFGAIQLFTRDEVSHRHDASSTKHVLPTTVFTYPEATLPPSTRTVARQCCRPVILRAARRVEPSDSLPDAHSQPNTGITTTSTSGHRPLPETLAPPPTHLRLWLPGAQSASSLLSYADSGMHHHRESDASEEPLGSAGSCTAHVRCPSEIILGKLLVRIQHQHHHHSQRIEVAPGDVNFDRFRDSMMAGFALDNYSGPFNLSYHHPVTRDERCIQNQADWQQALELAFREGQGVLDVMLRTLSPTNESHEGHIYCAPDTPAAQQPAAMYPLRWHFPLTARDLLTPVHLEPPASRDHDDLSQKRPLRRTSLPGKDADALLRRRRRQRYAAELYARLGRPMKHIAAYALLVLGGNEQPSADDVKKVISACDGEVDDAQLEKLLADLADKTFAELVDSGLEKIKDIAIGGGGGGGGGGGAAAGGDGAAAEEAKAEENEEEEEEEIDMAGGMDMFGDDGGGDDY